MYKVTVYFAYGHVLATHDYVRASSPEEAIESCRRFHPPKAGYRFRVERRM